MSAIVACVAIAGAAFVAGTPAGAVLQAGAAGGVSAGAPRAAQAAAEASAPARRIISVVPALTEVLFAVGAGPQVVAVSSYDDFPPEVRPLPRVGALLDPDTERILSLRPDLVVIYGSQSDLQARLARAGIRTYGYRHGGLRDVVDTIRDIGPVVGRAREAERLAAGIEARLDAIAARVRGRPRPRTALVFGRDAGALRGVYASGGLGFLHEMLEVAGGANVFADVDRESVQPSIETILARAPEVIIEIRATDSVPAAERARDRGAWEAVSSVPAVRSGRVYFLYGEHLVLAGPRVVDGAEALARTLHPDAFE